MNCSACQVALSPKAKFCTQCGAKVMVRCQSCQAECQPTSKFCSHCGTLMTALERPTPVEPEGDRRVVTILFTDVSGFTAMSEKLDPGQLTTIVNQFFAVLTEPIYRFGGVVDKYIGDAIMALFGAPIAHEDDPERAVHAAFGMQEAAGTFADDLFERTGIRLKVRIGLNTGLVVTGAVGGGQKRDYTVLGDTVHLAQRMESLARPGKILVTHETYKHASHAFEFMALEPIVMKGRPQALPVYEVVGPTHQREAVRERGHFVNRKRELDSLQLSWDRACQGLPQLVVVHGEAGIGKSQLVAHFVQTRCLPAPTTIRARCQSYTSTSSFGLLTGMLHYWLDVPPSIGSTALRQRLIEELAGVAPEDAARLADRIGLFLGLEPTDPQFASLSQEQRRNAALNAMHDVLLRLGSAAPLLLSLEDLQWADEASLEWLKGFFEATSQHRAAARIFVLCQHRPDAKPLPTDRWKLDLTRIQVRALELAECMAIAAGILRAPLEALDPATPVGGVLHLVLEQASGNPFYLHELITSLLDGQILRQGPDGLEISGDVSNLKLPTNLQGAVASRLDRLERGLRSLLQTGSVLGRTFSAPILATLGVEEGIHEGLDGLCRLGFLYQNSQGDYAFTQPLIQEVAYQSMLMSLRRELHARTGSALEKLYVDHLEENAHLLAHHFVLAEQHTPAFHYLYLSARRAYDFYDLSRARADLERALGLTPASGEAFDPPRWQALWLLGQVLTSLAAYDVAFSALEEAFALAPDVQARAQVLRTQGDAHERKGEFAAALECYHDAHDTLPAEAKHERAPMRSKMGYAKTRLGQLDDAIRLSLEALDLMEGTDLLKDQGFTHTNLGICYWRRGDTERAIQHSLQALEFRQACNDITGLGTTLNMLANIYSDRGEFDKADEFYRRSLEAYERIGDSYYISLAHNNLGTLKVSRGDFDEAERHFRQALELLEKSGAKQLMGIALFNIGDVLSKRGRSEEALATMHQALEIFHELDFKEVFSEVFMTMARVCAELLRAEEAEGFLRQSRQFAEEVGDDVTLAQLPRIQSQLRMLEGDLDRALLEAQRALELIEAQDAPIERGKAFAQLSAVLQARGEALPANEALEQARRLFEELGATHELARLPGPVSA